MLSVKSVVLSVEFSNDCNVAATTLSTGLRPAFPAERFSDDLQPRTAINIISAIRTGSAISSSPIERSVI